MSKSKPPEPPPSPKRPSKHILGGTHDDPIVVDNGPVRVDFGPTHKVTRRAETFTRRCTPIRLLIATIVDDDGVRDPIVIEQGTLGVITLDLEDGPAKGELSFEQKGLGPLVVTATGFHFKLEGRRLHPVKSEPRIVNIRRQGRSLLRPGIRRTNDAPTKPVVIVALIPVGAMLP